LKIGEYFLQRIKKNKTFLFSTNGNEGSISYREVNTSYFCNIIISLQLKKIKNVLKVLVTICYRG